MIKSLRNTAVLFNCVLLAGCSFLSPVKMGPDTGFVIDQMPSHVKRVAQRHATFLAMRPDTYPAYNTSRIAFTMRPHQISYYAYSRWIEAPADMYMPLIAKTLEKTHRFSAVVSPPYVGQYDYALMTQIKMFQVDYTVSPAMFRLGWQAQLLRARDGRLMASKEFNIAAPLPCKSPYGAAVAANDASAQLLGELASWVTKQRL